MNAFGGEDRFWMGQAEELAPGQSVEHVHRTLHLIGEEAALDKVAHAVLGIHLGDIATNLPAPAK